MIVQNRFSYFNSVFKFPKKSKLLKCPKHYDEKKTMVGEKNLSLNSDTNFYFKITTIVKRGIDRRQGDRNYTIFCLTFIVYCRITAGQFIRHKKAEKQIQSDQLK